MSDEKALLSAIWEHPHDDTARLVYADWLQENGQPERAEFIRLQCELARLDEWDESPARAKLARREQKLWKQHAKEWREGLPAELRREPFRRGFVAPGQRRATAAQFRDRPTSAFEAAPAWDYLIEDHTEGPAKMAKSPNLLRVEKLKFWTSVMPAMAAEVLGSDLIRNLRALSLGHSAAWVKGLPALAANGLAESLTELDVHEGFDDKAAKLLGSSRSFARLRAFSTYSHTLTAKGLRSIFNSPRLTELTELTLPAWYGEEGARAIAETRPKFRLRKLSMYGSRMPDEATALIANWPGLESVRSFNISGFCEVLGPRALASSPYARNLRELDLGLSHLSRAGAMALAKSKTLNLRRLVIRLTPAEGDDAAIAALVKRFGKDAVKMRPSNRRKRN